MEMTSYNVARQGEFVMYTVVLTIDELIDNSYIDLFSSDKSESEGYQRPLIPSHYRKIAKYLQGENPILPPSILTAADLSQISPTVPSGLKIDGKLRIVDGQHRIAGFSYLRDTDYEAYSKISDYQIPVTIMVISSDDKIHEINTFIDINSKGKKVSTDLAIRLREKIREKGKANFYSNKVEVLDHISTKITKQLNDSNLTVWSDAIKVGPDQSGRIISINAFNKSLHELISIYWEKGLITSEVSASHFVDFTADLLIDAWRVIEKKWPSCFYSYQKHKFNNNYNIQKGIGVNSLHQAITVIIKSDEIRMDKYDILDNFANVIEKSKVKSTDWITGGNFAGYNSKAGFNKLAAYIITGIL